MAGEVKTLNALFFAEKFIIITVHFEFSHFVARLNRAPLSHTYVIISYTMITYLLHSGWLSG